MSLAHTVIEKSLKRFPKNHSTLPTRGLDMERPTNGAGGFADLRPPTIRTMKEKVVMSKVVITIRK